jgi:steroid 5-alpha reductase family enzyme
MTISATLVPGLLSGIAWSAVGVLGTMAVAFVLGRILHRYRDIDVFWPLGFVVVAVIGYLTTSGAPEADVVQRTVLLLLTALWGVRLSFHLAMRSRGEGEDPRYAAIMRRAKGSEVLYGLVVVYGLQAILMLFVSLPVTVGMHAGSPLGILQVLGILVWLVGFGFETIGDAQLEAFKRDPENAGKVMDQGLWAWTRHPNYFGDACVWWGIFLVASAGGWGLLTVLSPLLMTRLLTSVSGKPLLEARMAKTRAGFADYVERTSSFLPRPPRRP